MIVEFARVDGCAPSGHALGTLRQWFSRFTAHDVQITQGTILGRPEDTDLGTVRQLVEWAARDTDADVFVIYLPKFRDNLGIAWDPLALSRELTIPVVGIFTETIAKRACLWITQRKVEAAVLAHEMGHAAGLASGLTSDGWRHCRDPGCRMYHGVDRYSMWANWWPVVRGVIPIRFCNACTSDLAAWGRG